MQDKNQGGLAVVITTINKPNPIIRRIAKVCSDRAFSFFVVGDRQTPARYRVSGCDYYDLKRQVRTGLRFAQACPERSCSRKNIGYLLAMRQGASPIVETDDDTMPVDGFWDERDRFQQVSVLARSGWVNVLKYFTKRNVWPRGFPLEEIHSKNPTRSLSKKEHVHCPIQHGLIDADPDVDAIYRLTSRLPVRFKKLGKIALASGSWCPFNSSNITWWPEAYPLMYLPSFCAFRVADIWRSFIAQRIAWTNSWAILHHGPTLCHHRSRRNLLREFGDEVSGYLHNGRIAEALQKLSLKPGVNYIPENLRACYEALVRMGLVPRKELKLLSLWLKEFHS